jgi:hypothetical protein
VAEQSKVSRACENALEAYDIDLYNRIIVIADTYSISYFTYMRLDPKLMDQTCLYLFQKFVEGIQGTWKVVKRFKLRKNEATADEGFDDFFAFIHLRI